METVADLFKSGNLAEALDAVTAKVKAAPSDLETRWLLSELLVVSGQTDRADQQLDALMNLEPRASVTAVPVRQLLRAEAARRQFFDEGRMPELIDGADDAIRARLQAFVMLRAGDRSGAGQVVEQAEKDRPALAGRMGDREFSDFRDLDDITAGVFEVLTRTGKYYWIPMNRVDAIEFKPAERPLDFVWRQAHIIVRDAFEADVHLPAVYGSLQGCDDSSRLGQRTDWLGADGEAVVGVGRRLFLLDGEETVDMMDLQSLTFG
jgi:type VI secretion system protein ImpE